MSGAKSRVPLKSLMFYPVFAALVLVGLYASWLRFSRGLGATTDLSDQMPWGLWVWLDLTLIALSSGGFIFCALFFVFHIESLKPLVRPAVLTAFFGYSLAAVMLIYDLGLPLHFWHPIVMWNHHSAMFEVSWCLMLYLSVLGIELSIPFTEGLGLFKISGLLHKLCAALALAGAILSLLHQSSFGALFALTPEKLNPIWYSSWIPYLFLLSAPAGGIGFLSLVMFAAEKFAGKILTQDLIRTLNKSLLAILGVYLAAVLIDFSRLGKWGLIPENPGAAADFGMEISLGVILPMVLLCFRKIRESRNGLLSASLLAILGILLNRLNVVIVGYLLENQAHYFPTWQEFAIAIMLLALIPALIALASRLLPIFQAGSCSCVRE